MAKRKVERAPDQPGVVQGVRHLHRVLRQEGPGDGCAGQGRARADRRLCGLQAVRDALPGPGNRSD